MHIGKLNERITLQQPAARQDQYGQGINDFRDVETVWSAVKSGGGSEKAGEALEVKTVVSFTVRHRTDITPAWRVKFNGRFYQVHDLEDRGFNAELIIKTTAVN